jgi:hypothetical protein
MARYIVLITICFWVACNPNNNPADKHVNIPAIKGVDLSKYTKLSKHPKGTIYYSDSTQGEFFTPSYKSFCRVIDVRSGHESDFVYFDTLLSSPNVYSTISISQEKLIFLDSKISITYKICPDGLDSCHVEKLVIK